MPFISYAQNFEDVLLWRALGHVKRGFFIDVGAFHPDLDSVTRAFSDRGWRGINIEPLPAQATLFRSARPRDVTLQVAVGADNGRLPFHVVADTGLSTLDDGVARAYHDGAFAVATEAVDVLTLATICALHAEPDIHFLKIDVEGAERAVLLGADLQRFRPWIVIAEATVPGHSDPAHQGWEPLLLAADYEFVWFDGLNRFYVAAEHASRLRGAFNTPPNVFDDFVRATDNSWIARFDTANVERVELQRQLESAREGLRQSADRERRHADHAGHEINRLRTDLAVRNAESASLRQRADTADHVFALRHRDMEELRASRHEARHELQQTHLRLQATEQERNAARHELQQTHLRLQAAERERDAALQRHEALEKQVADETEVLRLARERHEASPLVRRIARGVRRRLIGRPVPPAMGAETPGPVVPAAPTVAEAVKVSEPARDPAVAPETHPAPDSVVVADVETPRQTSDAIPSDAVVAPLPETRPALPLSPPPPFIVPLAELGGLRVVHQFHSGSAVGDAITNALLMVRGVLRAMGYTSDVFVERPPAELAHELRAIEELPRHDGYVLLQHHSMGYDRFDEILDLPAPRVLVYHNITPPELLSRHPHLAHYAALGREQLSRFRGRIAAALAISDYNSLELNRLGLAPVRTCNLLFDLDALRRRRVQANAAPDGLRETDVFTILFVGRINQSKNQLRLIDAFARFHALHDGRCRLVLVGRADGPDDPYLASLQRRIAEAGLEREVVLTGGVTDQVLDAWYAASDLYVSLSLHEGFGVPLVEAMTHGVPVLAFGAGAVPYTLGGVAEPLVDLSPDVVAARMLALAGDPGARARQGSAQTAALDRFALPRQVQTLQDALLRAGAALPLQTGSILGSPALNETLRFSVTGHVNGSYSLAAINRDLVLALERARPGHVRLLPVEGTPTLDLSGVPGPQQPAIRALALRAPHETGPVMVISQHYPVLPPQTHSDLAVALLFWEESRLPPDTVAMLGRHFDAVVAPTRFVRDVLIESGLAVPVRVIPPALDLDRFAALAAQRGDEASPVHRFLHVSSCFPRKGVDVLLHAWATAFRAGDPVSLVVKAFPNPHNEVAAQLAAIRAADPDMAPVTLLDEDLDENGLLALYASADTMVLPTRGEGLNMPAAEALAAGLGLIVTGGGGHMDFCRDPNEPDRARPGVRLLRFRRSPSGSHLATPHSTWFEPDEADLVAALRERHVAAPNPRGVLVAADATEIARAYTTLAEDLLRNGLRRRVRIGWVSSWGVRCGVAEYSRQLLFALSRLSEAGEPVPEVRVLADRRTLRDNDDLFAAWPCWTAGDPATLPSLATAIAADDADAVMIQHQPGLLSFPLLAELLHHHALDGRVVMVTLHNTVDILELAVDELDRLRNGLQRVDRVLVHTEADLDRLHTLALCERMTLLPHGVPHALAPSPARALVPGEHAPRIGCYGFFLPGKGIDTLIGALAILRRRWPGAELVLVNAEYDAHVSAEEIARCRTLAARLGIEKAVQFETSFLPNPVSLDLLSLCDVIALPYRPSCEASSAALRGAMSSGVPVAVTPIALFDEAGTAVFRFDGLDEQAIAASLDRLLAGVMLRERLGETAARWLAERQWPPIARQVAGMVTGQVLSARLEGR